MKLRELQREKEPSQRDGKKKIKKWLSSSPAILDHQVYLLHTLLLALFHAVFSRARTVNLIRRFTRLDLVVLQAKKINDEVILGKVVSFFFCEGESCRYLCSSCCWLG